MNTSLFMTPTTTSLIWMYIHFSAHIVLMISAILFLFQLGGYNPAKFISSIKIINIFIMLIIIASILMYITNRNFYLPFLGLSAYPCGSLAEKIPINADVSILVNVKPNANVIYWASESTELHKQPISNPWDAYANYDNSGVVRADANGNAILRVRKPSSYRVGLMNKELKNHIHYRVCNYSGLMSDIKTVNI
jgi:hypothetical protein